MLRRLIYAHLQTAFLRNAKDCNIISSSAKSVRIMFKQKNVEFFVLKVTSNANTHHSHFKCTERFGLYHSVKTPWLSYNN